MLKIKHKKGTITYCACAAMSIWTSGGASAGDSTKCRPTFLQLTVNISICRESKEPKQIWQNSNEIK